MSIDRVFIIMCGQPSCISRSHVSMLPKDKACLAISYCSYQISVVVIIYGFFNIP